MDEGVRVTAEGTLAGVGRYRGTGDTRQRCCRLLDGTVGGNGSCRIEGQGTLGNGVADYLTAQWAATGVAAWGDRGHSATVLPIT